MDKNLNLGLNYILCRTTRIFFEYIQSFKAALWSFSAHVAYVVCVFICCRSDCTVLRAPGLLSTRGLIAWWLPPRILPFQSHCHLPSPTVPPTPALISPSAAVMEDAFRIDHSLFETLRPSDPWREEDPHLQFLDLCTWCTWGRLLQERAQTM